LNQPAEAEETSSTQHDLTDESRVALQARKVLAEDVRMATAAVQFF
jgi:ferredoxin